MFKKITFLVVIFCCLINQNAIAQTTECGVGILEGAAIKQRMLDNRNNIKPAELDALASRRTTTWIPITLRIVGDLQGNGYTPLLNVFEMICDLNNDYASQNIQFYLNSPITYLNNQFIHDNAFSISARNAMRNNKVANTLNIYVGQSVNNPTASYYAGVVQDFVFMLDAQVSGTTSTCSHEVGHFFTLPHTFFGWENIDYQATYNGGNAPNTVNGRAVERAARTGSGANCSTAADGFCDTHPDYYYTRENCPYSSQGLVATDPTGVTVFPSDSNVMSYFVYGCRRVFSPDQRTAILADLVGRGWSNFAGPTNPVTNLDGTNTTTITPLDGETKQPTGGLMRLEWTASPGATAYYLEIYPTNFFGIPNTNMPLAKLVVQGNNYYNIIGNQLNNNGTYAWRVRPINEHDLCGALSQFFKFTVGTPTNIQTIKGDSRLVSIAVTPNPIRSSAETVVQIDANEQLEGTFRLSGIDGRILKTYPAQLIQKGENKYRLNIADLTTGTYIITLTTSQGVLHQKITVLR